MNQNDRMADEECTTCGAILSDEEHAARHHLWHEELEQKLDDLWDMIQEVRNKS